MQIITPISLGLLLSIDVFFTMIVYATVCKKNKNIIEIPFLVGIFHFVFPLVAFLLLSKIDLPMEETHLIAAAVFLFMGIKSFLDKDEDDVENSSRSTLWTNALLAGSVSLDSLALGSSLAFGKPINIWVYAMIFGIVSFTITITAIMIGKTLKKQIKYDLSVLSGCVFFLLAILFFVEVI